MIKPPIFTDIYIIVYCIERFGVFRVSQIVELDLIEKTWLNMVLILILMCVYIYNRRV
jgi:hypothetical protein